MVHNFAEDASFVWSVDAIISPPVPTRCAVPFSLDLIGLKGDVRNLRVVGVTRKVAKSFGFSEAAWNCKVKNQTLHVDSTKYPVNADHLHESFAWNNESCDGYFISNEALQQLFPHWGLFPDRPDPKEIPRHNIFSADLNCYAFWLVSKRSRMPVLRKR
ncbi:hypothetical protein EG68_01574 [Paragonimus skrjabini miyazakii]|uniref:Uncharacterized protein n=1 Tax=Paragonimus skrjabini miyazakii TaxID=59628 RepID=A0A8S9Z872_9TREM|nr:hypothetical protein EG68_01574 [Paragonimus skrjabini miyazakii]